MKQTLFLAFLLIAPILIKAQVPGYQGKRCFIEAGVSFFPNLGAPSLEFQNSFSMKAYYSFSCNYTLKRKMVLRAAYTHQASGLISNIEYHDDYWSMFYYLYMNDVNFALNIYGKRVGNLAPLGFYFSPGIRFVFAEGALQKKATGTPPQITVPNNLFSFALGFAASIGYRTILPNKVIFNFAFEMTLFPQHFFGSLGSVGGYQRDVIQTIADRYLFGLHIGMGVFLF